MTDIVCTLTDDDARERLAEYARLFAAAYAGRERTAAGMRWSLRADPGVAEWARDLAARERACCAFLTIAVTEAGRPRAVGGDRRPGGAGRRRPVLRPAGDRCERHTSHDRTCLRCVSTRSSRRAEAAADHPGRLDHGRPDAVQGRGARPVGGRGHGQRGDHHAAAVAHRRARPTRPRPGSPRGSPPSPARRSRAAGARSVGSSTIVYGVIRRGAHVGSRASSSSGGNAASSTFPVLVVGQAAACRPGRRSARVCGLSRRST